MPLPPDQHHRGWSGLLAIATLGGVSVLACLVTWVRARRARKSRNRARHALLDGSVEQLERVLP
jgi:hypothetical protein